MNLAKFIDLLSNRALFFTRVDKFFDPYEGRVTNENLRIRDEADEEFKTILPVKNLSFEIERKRSFLNCWHLSEEESPHMWQIYASNDAGIAITSTFEHIKECFNKLKEPVYIGKVQYINYETEAINEINFFNFFIHKRKFFSYENELRVVTQVPDEEFCEFGEATESTDAYVKRPMIAIHLEKLPQVGMHVNVDMDILIDEIYISHLAQDYFRDAIKAIVDKFSFDPKKLVYSKIYNRPE